MTCQYASEESPSTIWVEVRDTSGPMEALRSWAAPTRGLTGGWPDWCWVHSELETAQEAGRPSTVGGEDTGEVVPREEQSVLGHVSASGTLPSLGWSDSQGPLCTTTESDGPWEASYITLLGDW